MIAVAGVVGGGAGGAGGAGGGRPKSICEGAEREAAGRMKGRVAAVRLPVA